MFDENKKHEGSISPVNANNIPSEIASPRQALFYVEEKLHPGIPLNNVISIFSINGVIDHQKFKKSFEQVVHNNPCLSSVIEESGSDIILRKKEFLEIPFEYIDYSNTEEPQQKIYDWRQSWSKHVFTNDNPLYKASLIKVNENEFVFYLNTHHAITDAFSVILTIQQIEKLYCDELNHRNKGQLNAPLLKYSFHNFLKSLKHYIESENAVINKNFWKKRYEKPSEEINFYGQRNKNKSALTTRLTRNVKTEVSQSIWALSSEVSPAIIFTAVLFSLLRRISLNSDLILGVSLLNRDKDFLNTLGLFMDICPSRINISGDDTFTTIVEKVISEIQSIKPHRRHSVSSRTAGYEVLLSNYITTPENFNGQSASLEYTTPLNILDNLDESIDPETNFTGRESLNVQVYNYGKNNNFKINFDFNNGVWRENSQREIAIEQFLLLLEEFTINRERKIEDIDILIPIEREKILLNNNKFFDKQLPILSIVENIEIQAKSQPDNTAIIFEDIRITYKELFNQMLSFSQYLHCNGVGADTLVGVCLERSEKLIITLLAIMNAGGTYVPIDPKHPSDRICLILDDANPHILITQKNFSTKLGDSRKDSLICIDEKWDEIISTEQPNKKYIKGELAYIIFTSGSTGHPKGVEVKNHGLNTFLQAMREQPGITKEDLLLAVTTISFDIAALEIYLPLIVGARVQILPYEKTLDGKIILEIIKNHKVSILQATPATFRIMLAAGWQESSHLKILCGGEALPFELAQEMLKRSNSVWNMYGPTETTIWSSIKKLEPDQATVSIGKPIKGTQIYILNSYQQQVPLGVTGELYIAGDGLAKGYYKREDLTNKQFIKNTFSEEPDALMYKTGDLVRFLPNQDIEYIGRADYQVKIRGFRIELGEIEAALNAHTEIKQSIVITHPTPNSDQELVAYIIYHDDKSPDSRKIRKFLKSKIPLYMIPSIIVEVSEWPLTPNGKVNRKALALPEIELEKLDDENYVAPRNDFETSLVEVWQRVLGVKRIGIKDDFFELGGHSILALTLVQEIEKATNIPVEFGVVFDASTIELMVDAIDPEAPKKSSIVVSLQSSGNALPIFCLCGIHLYQEFANKMEQNPVYGIYVAEEQKLLEQAISGKSGNVTVTDLANKYCEAILKQQPDGPYQLVGVSFGGLVCIETARLLKEKGKHVKIVILLDAILTKGIHRNKIKWFLQHVVVLFKNGPFYYLNKINKLLRNKFPKISSAPDITSDIGNGFSDDDEKTANVREQAYIQAMSSHESIMKPYNGDVLLLRAKDKSNWGRGITFLPDYGWNGIITGKLQIQDIPGTHLGILTEPFVEGLSKAVDCYID